MAQIVKLRRSATTGNKPTTAQLELGELAMNTYDGKIYFEKSGSAGESIEEILTTNAQNTGSLSISGSSHNITGALELSGSLKLPNTVRDYTNSTGSVGQVLQITENGAIWIDNIAANVGDGRTAKQTFAASTTWVFTHNLNEKYPVVELYDIDDQILAAPTVATNSNTLTITFAVPVAGTAVATVGGMRGYQGYQGFQGQDGYVGADGAQGAQGNRGFQGFQGVKGDQGVTGAQGFQGPIGFQGSQGETGAQGAISASARNVTVFTTTLNQTTFTVPGGYNIGLVDVFWNGVKQTVGVDYTASNGTTVVLANGAAAGDTIEINNYLGEIGSQGNQGATGAQGSVGAQGATGNQGTVGAQGPTGSQGSVGAQGSVGPQGETGFQGNQGPTGLQGAKGDQGFQGIQGFQGDQGIQGTKGDQGDQGFQGAKGDQGNQGPIGLQGIKGDKGDQGDRGFQGDQGIQGTIGTQGTTGVQGAKGDQGYQGITGQGFIIYQTYNSVAALLADNTCPDGQFGLVGGSLSQSDPDYGKLYLRSGGTWSFTTDMSVQGIQGSTGAQGSTGQQGFKGDQGNQGDQGARGFQGDQGRQGSQGDRGFQGFQGLKGDKGDKGDQGDRGFKGDQGDRGFQGFKGDQGDRGFQGFQGFKGDKGDQGDRGFQGFKGDKGDKGDQGDRGFQGFKGDKGDQGDRGFQGFQGFQGIQGATGTANINGTGFVKASGTTISYDNTTYLNAGIGLSSMSYSAHDFNSYPNLYNAVFINAATSTNVPGQLAGSFSYRFVMGGGDTSNRGFDLLGYTGGMLMRERSTGTWWNTWHSGNLTNLNQLTNGPGYITGYTETDTLQSVILRNSTTNTGFTITNANDTYSTPASTNVPVIYLYNTGTTSTSNAVLSLRTNSATGGDPILSFDIGGVQGWSMGIDNSDADRFKIARSWASLDSDTRFRMDVDGTAAFTGNLTAANLSGTNTGDQTNISGNAATATNVAWTGVTGRPTAVSSFTNDSGYITQTNALQPIYGDSGAHNLNVSGQHANIRYSTGVWVNPPTPGNYSHVLSFNLASDHRTVQMYLGDVPGYLWWRMAQGPSVGFHPWERIWTSASLTNLNQLTNGPGYITGYTETDTLATVVGRGSSTGGGRPITLDNGGGSILVRASTGGWSMGTYYQGSSGTTLAGFGAYGGNNSLTWAWIGPGYENPWMTINSSQATINVPISTGAVSTNNVTINRDLGTNDYSGTGQHNMQLRIRKASSDGGCAPRTLELGVLDNGTGIIQANHCGVGYNTLALNPVAGAVTIGGNTAWHAGNLTNLNQLTNGPGYITGESDTLASVTGRGASTSTAVTFSGGLNVASSKVGFRNAGLTEFIQGESWTMGIYGYNYNDGFLFYQRDLSDVARPCFHIGGWNNAGYGGYSNADSMITLVRGDGVKTDGSTYATRGLSSSSFYSNIIKTTGGTVFRDSQSSHTFTGGVVVNGTGVYTVGDGGAGSQATVVAIRVRGLSGYESLEIGTENNYDGVIRSYGNDLRYYSGHWRTVGNTSSENHSHYWYTSKAGSTNWSSHKMRLDHDGILTVASHISTPGILHTNRNRVAFSSTATDANHSIYNNYNNIDGEGSFDGFKMNVYAGLHVRVGNASGAVPTMALDVTSTRTSVATGELWCGASNSRDGAVGLVLNDGALHVRAHNDRFHKIWYFDGIAFATNSAHGHFRFYAESNTQRSSSSGGATLVFDIDSVNGNTWASGDITAYSDARVKTNVTIIENALEKVQAIRGVTFNRTDAQEQYKDKRHAGVIAQEILEVLPEVVTTDKEGMHSVAYGNLNALLIEAIKEQQTQIESQKTEIEELKDLVKQLINR
jgi:hypothetical protein